MPDHLVWRCSCGQEWEEDGSGVAQSQAWRHLMEMKKVVKVARKLAGGEELTASEQRIADSMQPGFDPPDHEAIGLVDKDSGAVLLDNFNATESQRAGYTRKREDSWYAAKKTGHREIKLGVGASRLATAEPPAAPGSAAEDVDEEPPKRKRAGKRGGDGDDGEGGGRSKQPGSPLKGRMTYMTIPIRPQLYFLYIAAMSRFDGLDDSPESFEEWLSFCVFKLYSLFPRVFGVDKLIAMQQQGGS